MRWDEETGRVSIFRKPSNFANGNTRDRQGRLLTCEHDTRRVSRTEHDGTIITIADKFDGKPLNSPNDIVVKSDDSIWFTDPPFGILGNYEGHTATPELPTNVYRVDGRSGQITVATGDINRPNGLAFSPDEIQALRRRGRGHAARDPRLRRRRNGTKLANKRPFITAQPGETPDGFRVDVDGNLWCGWGMGDPHDGVMIFDSDRQADRQDRAAGALRQPLLRRRQAQPAVHGREPLGLFALRQHPGRQGRVSDFAPLAAGRPKVRQAFPFETAGRV